MILFIIDCNFMRKSISHDIFWKCSLRMPKLFSWKKIHPNWNNIYLAPLPHAAGGSARHRFVMLNSTITMFSCERHFHFRLRVSHRRGEALHHALLTRQADCETDGVPKVLTNMQLSAESESGNTPSRTASRGTPPQLKLANWHTRTATSC